MKQQLGLGSLLGGTAIALIASQPAIAVPTQVTGVQISPSNSGINLVLQTRDGDRPDIFTVSRGNTLVADITNTQLRLPQGNGFLQNNPAPGITSVMIAPLDSNSIRVTINGDASAPAGQVTQRQNGIVMAIDPSGRQAAQSTPVSPNQIAQQPDPAPVPPPLVPAPDVLVPNPQISIDGVPATGRSGVYVPPLQPRAIAPPLGDIAISNIDTSPATIDLNSAERVPRLVLRDAPVRDVLSLLARAAGLNVAYIGELPGATQQAAAAPGEEADTEVRISLDIENEPVQDVFNYVLRVAGLEANRAGRTIFVGPRLPDDARATVARTLRLNQVTATDAANFLTAQGAETQIPFERVEITVVGEGAAARTIESRTPDILALRATEGEGPLLLRGVSISTNERLNTITLVGPPRRIEIATNLLAQLDLRRRQAAINVRIVDVNLLATEDINTSFSFGIGDTFFTSDGGAASFNYGGANPPTRGQFDGSVLTPPIIGTPFPEGVDDPQPFIDAQPDAPFGTGEPQPFGNPPLNDGTIQIPSGQFFRPPFGTNSNPLQGGVTRLNPDGSIEIGLPELFQFPSRFLATLQAQVVSGNAKILTDPTLTVQEGQRAQVRLTTEVFGGFSAQREPIIKNAGLTLDIVLSRIDDNGFVTLAVIPTVSSVANVFNTQQGDIVLLQERRVDSGQLRVRDGQTLILSGIIQETDRATVSKIPILGDIPLLGALFRSTERENTRQEVIVLLTPQVINDSDLSNFGYSYTPGREAQQLLQRQGVQFP
ncbi:AMIN domain-containing protein [Oscillatoria sp. FACHB-1407]|uniref:AMIN domain-containing protein n=1 Tax=Oscillatoria sp. FACHB-1407 TaxID=2692847 RepID=UPI001685E6FC|nr:AMIN domain-containing protein [Oscillatoria sp. FACHB-1407]MBD2462745.1 AMIN domain-containing protein [Oscillatoria sp. FACHB-1407]